MDSRTPRDGKAIEEVGTYDPMIPETDKRVTMKADRIDYWLSVGAQPTEKVKILIDKYKGKVPDIRIDKPVERAVPELARLSAEQRAPKRPKKEEAAPAEPQAEAEATESPEAESSEPAAEE